MSVRPRPPLPFCGYTCTSPPVHKPAQTPPYHGADPPNPKSRGAGPCKSPWTHLGVAEGIDLDNWGLNCCGQSSPVWRNFEGFRFPRKITALGFPFARLAHVSFCSTPFLPCAFLNGSLLNVPSFLSSFPHHHTTTGHVPRGRRVGRAFFPPLGQERVVLLLPVPAAARTARPAPPRATCTGVALAPNCDF